MAIDHLVQEQLIHQAAAFELWRQREIQIEARQVHSRLARPVDEVVSLGHGLLTTEQLKHNIRHILQDHTQVCSIESESHILRPSTAEIAIASLAEQALDVKRSLRATGYFKPEVRGGGECHQHMNNVLQALNRLLSSAQDIIAVQEPISPTQAPVDVVPSLSISPSTISTFYDDSDEILDEDNSCSNETVFPCVATESYSTQMTQIAHLQSKTTPQVRQPDAFLWTDFDDDSSDAETYSENELEGLDNKPLRGP